MNWLERLAVLLASLALSGGLIAALSGFFARRDQGAIEAAGAPGQGFRDLGDRPLAPGQLRPAYDSDPPTSGAHATRAVTRDEAPLSDDQLLTALAAGDVVIMYGGRVPPASLVALARSVAGPFTPSLAAAGQAVILAPRQGISGVVALAWARMLRVADASDPRLRAFASFWLGRGAPR